MINYYEILGIAQDSTAQEIKKSFRKRAKEIHPDVHPDSERRSDDEMRLLLSAYEVLSDMQKRDEYDRTLHSVLRKKGFDYREFLRRRADDPQSQSKLIFHDLLANHQEEAVELYERLSARRGFELERFLSREDYMDCAFLLAEVFEARLRYNEAYELYLKLYYYECDKPYFHHFINEVIDRLRTLLCFKMLPGMDPQDAIGQAEGDDKAQFFTQGRRVLLQKARRGLRRPGPAGVGAAVPAERAAAGQEALRREEADGENRVPRVP